MKFAIRLLCPMVESMTTAHDGNFVVEYIPERWPGSRATGMIDDGFLRSTPDLAEAKIFDDASIAFEYYRAPVPGMTRWDGEPERPLTGYIVEIVPIIYEVPSHLISALGEALFGTMESEAPE